MANELSRIPLEERLRRSGRQWMAAMEPRWALLDFQLSRAALPIQLGHYTLTRYLGEGAAGRVYEAFDQAKDQRVAMKVFRDSGSETQLLLKRESRALARVSHPNLVTFLEAGVEQGVCYLTMELIEGTELAQYVHQDVLTAPNGSSAVRADLGRLRAALHQLASALATLHAAGMVHRDVKPSNVLVTAAGRVVVVDLGVCHSPEPLHTTFSGRAVGTPAYMAPEQLRRGTVTAASDCYAIGVMLFEALVGTIPLSARGHDELLRLRSEGPAPWPKDFVAEVPSDLDALCHELLAANPADRPSCNEILERLGTVTLPISASRLGDGEDDQVFVGRHLELEALRSALAASANHCVAVAIAGTAGIGKSTLVKQFLRELPPEGHVILAAKCHERETLPNKIIDALMDALVPYLKRLSAEDLQRVMPRHMYELARMFPALLRVEAFASAARCITKSDEQEQRRRALAALSELLGRITDRAVLVLWIDDLQWGDHDSVAIIRQLFSLSDAPHCLCIGTFRTDLQRPELQAERFLRHPHALSSSLDVRALRLEGLPTPEAEALTRKLVGDAANDTVQRVVAEAEGSPFLIAQLALHARSLQFAAAEGPMTLTEVVRARLERLSPAANDVLQLVALAASPIEQRVIIAAANLSDETVFHELRTAQLVRTQGRRGRVELYHGVLASAVLSSLNAQQLRALHARLAGALVERGVPHYERIALHLRAAGQLRESANYLLMVAERAARVLAHCRAAQRYGLALNPGLTDQHAQSMRIARAHALRESGKGTEAALAYLDAARREQDEWQRFELRRQAAQEFLLMGRLDEARGLLEELMRAVQLSLPRSRWSVVGGLFWRRAFTRARGVDFRKRPEDAVASRELTRLDTIWLLGQTLVMIDPLVGNYLQSRHVLLGLRCGEPKQVALERSRSKQPRRATRGRPRGGMSTTCSTVRADWELSWRTRW